MRTWLSFSGLAGLALFASTAIAADHGDSAGPVAEPTADINDVYAFMNGDNVVLIMTVNPDAGAGAQFSDAVRYQFHVDAHDAFGGTAGIQSTVTCWFDANSEISCNVNGDAATVSGDASDAAGLTNGAGNMKVFAGPRADPFFFNLSGFVSAINFVTANAAALLATAPASGCPVVDAVTSQTIVDDLVAGSQAGNDFAGQDVLAITLEIDKALLTDASNEVLSIWARTYTETPE